MRFRRPVARAPVVLPVASAIAIPNKATLDLQSIWSPICAKLTLVKADASTVDLHLSDIGFVSSGSDTPANTHFQARLTDALTIRQSISGRRLGGTSLARTGDMTISMADQSIRVDGATYTRRTLLQTFSANGQAIVIRAVPLGLTFATGITLFTGQMEDWAGASESDIRITLREAGERYDCPMQPFIYDQATEATIPDALDGKRGPVALGTVFNVAPPLRKQSTLLYDLCLDKDGDGAPIQSVDGVRIGGTALTPAGTADYATRALLEAATTGALASGADIEVGEYATCLAEGALRLAGEPGETLTVDMQGLKVLGALVTTPGEMAKAVLQQYCPQVADADLELSTFSTVDAERGYGLGEWIGPDESPSAADILSRICASFEGSWGINPATGKSYLTMTARPTGGGFLSFGKQHIRAGSYRALDLPAEVSPAVSDVTVRFKRNYSSNQNLVETVTSDDRATYSTEWRTTQADQSLNRFPDAKSLEVDTLVVSEADAVLFRTLLLDLYDGTLELGSFDAPLRGWTTAIGSKIEVDLPQQDIDATCGVVGRGLSLARRQCELEVILG